MAFRIGRFLPLMSACTLARYVASIFVPVAGAECVSSARSDLCGGGPSRPAWRPRAVPTATDLPAPTELRGALTTAYGATAIGSPTCSATGVQISVLTIGVSIDIMMAYRAPIALRSRFGWSFHQPLTG